MIVVELGAERYRSKKRSEAAVSYAAPAGRRTIGDRPACASRPTRSTSSPQLRSYGGLSGAEYETAASARFFERYLAAPEFNDTRDFLLAYELQKRYLRARRPRPDREGPRHGGARPGRRPALQAAARRGPQPDVGGPHSRSSWPTATSCRRAPSAPQVDEIIAEITKLTSADESGARDARWPSSRTRACGRSSPPWCRPPRPTRSTRSRRSRQLMVLARQTVAARATSPPTRAASSTSTSPPPPRSSVAAARCSTTRQASPRSSTSSSSRALTDATYGAGLSPSASATRPTTRSRDLLATPKPTRADLQRKLTQAERVVEWAQANATLAFAEVWAPWTLLLPQVAGIRDDILRGSPLLLYGQVAPASGRLRRRQRARPARPLRRRRSRPTCARSTRASRSDGCGSRRSAGGYTRDEIVALPETPADLDPAAGILTQGEGNVLSHVQLLARALGIPNVVLGPSAYAKVEAARRPAGVLHRHAGRARHPEGGRGHDAAGPRRLRRVHPQRASAPQTAASTAAGRASTSTARRSTSRKNMPIDLTDVRRSDSGAFCGPKAAYLGELKHLFPDHVARGIVVPFGAYYDHYQRAQGDRARQARGRSASRSPTSRSPDFVERTYKEFFDVHDPGAARARRSSSAWITAATRGHPHTRSARRRCRPSSRQAIRDGLDRDGLLLPGDKTQTVGCYVRSDTNVEDLDNFNGAGLNLTVFNRKSLDDIYDGPEGGVGVAVRVPLLLVAPDPDRRPASGCSPRSSSSSRCRTTSRACW